jgi:hypothetical protein
LYLCSHVGSVINIQNKSSFGVWLSECASLGQPSYRPLIGQNEVSVVPALNPSYPHVNVGQFKVV